MSDDGPQKAAGEAGIQQEKKPYLAGAGKRRGTKRDVAMRVVNFLLALLMFSIAAPATAEPFSDGGVAASRGDYANALRLWRPLAEQGDPQAQLFLGYLYKNGQGVDQDYTEAVKWFHAAANQGNAHAQSALGLMCEIGLGVPKDYSVAAMWFGRAAVQGNYVAQSQIGHLYLEGLGLTQNDVEAAKWFRHGANQGYAEAQINLGYLYESGRGVPQDYVQAHKWYNLATSHSKMSDKALSTQAMSNRDRIAAKMTPAKLSEALTLARGWKRPTP